MPHPPPMARIAQVRRSGLDFLKERSRLALRLRDAPEVKSVLIIDDNQTEAQRISVMVRLVLGDGAQVKTVRRLPDAKVEIQRLMPDVVFLDDRLGHSVAAETSLQQLKAFGLKSSPVVMSGLLTRVRLVELRRLGVADVMHKDDIDASRIMEALLRVVDPSDGGSSKAG